MDLYRRARGVLPFVLTFIRTERVLSRTPLIIRTVDQLFVLRRIHIHLKCDLRRNALVWGVVLARVLLSGVAVALWSLVSGSCAFLVLRSRLELVLVLGGGVWASNKCIYRPRSPVQP